MAKITPAGRVLFGTIILSVLVAGGWTLHKSSAGSESSKPEVVQTQDASALEPSASSPSLNTTVEVPRTVPSPTPVVTPSTAPGTPAATPVPAPTTNDSAINELSGMKTMKSK